MKQQAVRLLQRLSEAHGASGAEDPVRTIFAEELGGDLSTDRVGSVVCEQRGAAARPRVMLAAHLDEVGFAVQRVTAEGLLAIVPLGGWWGHTLLGQRMRVRTRSGREHVGVIAAKPPHMLEEAERAKVIKPDKMFIDVGARNAEDVRERFGIALGDPIVPASKCVRLRNDRLAGKAFDDRAGVGLVIQCLQALREAEHPNTVFGVGTVQEEVGTRGATTAVRHVDPDVAVVLEGTPADDFAGSERDAWQGVLGGGAQVRLLDPSALMNRRLSECALDTARACDVPVQVAVRRSGGTDAKVIHLHAEGVPTTVISVPVRYAHTHNGVMDLNDYLAALRLTVELVKRLDAATVQNFTAFSA